MTLFDEVFERYPDHTAVELSTTSAMTLDRDLLNPVAPLEHMLQTPPAADSLVKLVRELEWTGPPAGIRIVVYQDMDTSLEGQISTEVADAETFMYLIAWLLEWSQLPAFRWTEERIEGHFRADTKPHAHIYHVQFVLQTEPLHEEMIKYALLLQSRRE